MKLLLSSLLLASLRARSSWSVSSGTLVVTQTPDVSVMEGETVHITCCWTGQVDRMTVNWLKNQTKMPQREILFKNQSQGSLQSCSNLTLTNITREFSGRYICRLSVEIPVFTEVEGNGTVITVTVRDSTDDNTDPSTTDPSTTDPPIAGDSHREETLMYVLRCLPILALVITFFYLNKLRAKAQQHTPAAPGNKLTSAQRIEEDQEEEERDAE